ncbi:MAG: sulfatase-like hydrolase/transferase [Verrucomicrobiota bacterium JB024]|nr:sulfatase-like hydrolase/transferase [Verrucomicrobiota bacterium JB024]
MKQDSSQPNILLILTDQQRLSALGAYGETPCKTPHLDRLAARSARFETAYTTCPVCSPARGSVMTGQYPHAHGITSNVHDLGCTVHELTDRPELLSRRLLAAGYACGYTGKWHLGCGWDTTFGAKIDTGLPHDVGFVGHNFWGHGDGGHNYPEYQEYLRDHGWKHEVVNPIAQDPWSGRSGELTGPVESTVPYYLAEHTIGLMDQFARESKPFFLWHNFWGPHEPYYPTRDYMDMYRDVSIPEWPNYRWVPSDRYGPQSIKRHPMAEQLYWAYWENQIRHYYAFTTMIDDQIGRMLAHLDRSGLAENTIIIFSSDHGETLGSHGGLTDKGWHHFEEIQRIPLIVYVPEKYQKNGFNPRGVFQQWASLADFYPTILDYAGVGEASMGGVHGRSLRPVLEGTETTREELAAVEFFGVNALATSMITLRQGDLKYGWNCTSQDELYDLGKDPYEMNNLIDDFEYTEKKRQLQCQMVAWAESKKCDRRICEYLKGSFGSSVTVPC